MCLRERSLAVIASFLMLYPISACSNKPKPETKQGHVTIEGRVLDRADSLAVWQASVLFREVKMGAMTDTAGFYRVRNVPAGTYTIEVSSVTHATHSMQLTITAAPDTIQLDFYLDRKQYDNFGHPIDPADTLGQSSGFEPQ